MPLLLSSRAVTRAPIALRTSAEARALGIRLPQAGFVRMRAGVYADAADWTALPPWSRYATRVHAFSMAHPAAILSHESAAVIHGLPLFGEARDIHVFDPDRTTSRRFGDVCVHTSADGRHVDVVDGIAVTSLLDTAADLIRALPPAQALTVADAAISPVQGGPLTLADLDAAFAGRADARNARQIAWVLREADGRSESPGESVSRAVLGWCGFETPVLQPELRYEGFLDRADFGFASAGALGESDGWGKYDLGDPSAAQQHLRAEKIREDRLRRHGHPFARWDLADALRVEPMARALRQASVALVRAPDRARLATLRRSPRTVAR